MGKEVNQTTVIAVIGVVVLAVVGLGYYFMQNRGPSEGEVKQQQEQTVDQTNAEYEKLQKMGVKGAASSDPAGN